jgi:hydroxyacylglutathione hydrolase
MINIQRFVCNMFEENTYVVSDETNDAVIIDCGAFYEEERLAVVNYIKDNQLNLTALIDTHAHIDHCCGNDTIFKTFGIKPIIHRDDQSHYNILKQQAYDFCRIDYTNEIPAVEKVIEDNDTVKFGNHQLTAIHTPGHTPGSMILYCEREHLCFSGDTLFRFSIGRTDFPGGSFQEMTKSLKKIAKLPENTIVLTGHGEQTTIREELKMNPYLR